MLYIPIWFYSNRTGWLLIDRLQGSSKFRSGDSKKEVQSCSIQIYLHLNCIYYHTSLHSNLVLFKYGRSKKEFYNSYTFTFQSGSIQIKRVFLTSAISIPFTFQSGSIQMYFHLPCMYSHTALHSNLVLFKLSFALSFFTSLKIFFQTWFYKNLPWLFLFVISKPFTFQSGSIQMLAFSHSSTMYPTFTFQSGSIQIIHIDIFILGKRYFTYKSGNNQILRISIFKYKFNLLYIPIWFYSNEFHSMQS